MVDKNKIGNEVWRLCDALRGMIGYYDLYGSTVKLLFIKFIYTYPDKLPINDMEDYRKLIEFKRTLDAARNGHFTLQPADVKNVFEVVDRCAGDSNVRLADAVDSMQYFFEESQQRKVLDIIDSFPLNDDPEVMRTIFDVLVEHGTNDVKLTGENTTNSSLRKLAVNLLEINEDDSLLNSYCGFSTLLLNVEKVGQYAGYDLSPNNVQVSLMMALMLGLRNHSIYNDDFISAESSQKYTKAFMDGPLGIKKQIPAVDDKFGTLRDIEALGMYKTAEMLQEGGKAVFALPGKILFSSLKGMVNLRKYFIAEGLKSVIALPPLWQGAGAPTNLVVLEKGYSGDIAMIDAKNFFDKPVRKSNALSESNLHKIIEMSNANNNYNECAIVERNNPNLLDSWVPTSYITVESTSSLRNIDEINQELEKLYEELKSL